MRQSHQPENLLLSAKGLYKRFGGITAVNNAKIEVRRGSITGLIGPNGAGKSKNSITAASNRE